MRGWYPDHPQIMPKTNLKHDQQYSRLNVFQPLWQRLQEYTICECLKRTQWWTEQFKTWKLEVDVTHHSWVHGMKAPSFLMSTRNGVYRRVVLVRIGPKQLEQPQIQLCNTSSMPCSVRSYSQCCKSVLRTTHGQLSYTCRHVSIRGRVNKRTRGYVEAKRPRA